MPQQPISRYLEDHKLPIAISGRSSAPYRDIRELNIPPTEISGILIAFFPRSLECLNSPFRDIWKIISSLLRYPEDLELPTEIFGISTSRLLRYLEYR